MKLHKVITRILRLPAIMRGLREGGECWSFCIQGDVDA